MKGKTMHKQKGITLSGFLLWSIVVVFIAIMGFKVGPAYLENVTIQSHIKTIANDSNIPQTRGDIMRAFDSRTTVDNISAITAKDLEITKDGDRMIISATYTVCVPLIANMRACMDFNPSSDK
jgi:hypothetical protein